MRFGRRRQRRLQRQRRWSGDRRHPGLAQRAGHAAGRPRLAQGDLRGRPPRLHADHRGAAVGGARRAPHHRPLQRLRDPRRGRGRQHPGGDVHDRRRLQPTSPPSSTSLGGDDLLEGFVEAGSVDDDVFAVPYYAGSKYVFYRKDLFAASGIEVPTTTEEFVAAAIKLKQDNPEPGELLGLLVPGPGLAQRGDLRLERRRRPGCRRRRRVAGRALHARSPRPGWRRCRR